MYSFNAATTKSFCDLKVLFLISRYLFQRSMFSGDVQIVNAAGFFFFFSVFSITQAPFFFLRCKTIKLNIFNYFNKSGLFSQFFLTAFACFSDSQRVEER